MKKNTTNPLNKNKNKVTLIFMIFAFSLISFYTSYTGIMSLLGDDNSPIFIVFMILLVGALHFALVFSIKNFYLQDILSKKWIKASILLIVYVITMTVSVTFSFTFWYESFSAENYAKRSSELQLNKLKDSLLETSASFSSMVNSLNKLSNHSAVTSSKEKIYGGTCGGRAMSGEGPLTWLRADDAQYTMKYSGDIQQLQKALSLEIDEVSGYLERFEPKGDVERFNREVNNRVKRINIDFLQNDLLYELKTMLIQRSGVNRKHISVVSRKTHNTSVESCMDREFTRGAKRVIDKLNKIHPINALHFFNVNDKSKLFARTTGVLVAIFDPSYHIKKVEDITSPNDITDDDIRAVSAGFLIDFLLLLIILYAKEEHSDNLLNKLKNDKKKFSLKKEELLDINKLYSKKKLASMDIKKEDIQNVILFYEKPSVEFILKKVGASSYVKERDFFKISLPLSFDLQIDNFLLYITDKSIEELKEELQNRDEKIFVITKKEYQDEVAKFAENKTNRIIAPTVRELTNLLLNPKSKEVFIEILAKNLSFKYISPYQVNDAVKNESNFFGRVETVRDIITSDRKNYLIIGARQVGKSSVLEALKRRYANSQVVNCYSITLDEGGDILRAMSFVLGISKDSTLEEIEKRVREDKRKTVFLIDEADKFIQYEKSRGYMITSVFRKLSQEGEATFVLAGFWTLYHYVTMDYQSPLKNFGELIRLEGLETSACYDLMREPMKRIGVRYEDETILKKVIERCGNRANLIAVVCSKTLQSLDTNVITNKDIENVFDNGNLGDFLNDWGSLSSDREKNRIDRIIIYMTIEKENFKLSDLVKLFREKDLKVDIESISKSLNRLVLGYILYKSKGYYSYRIPLFKEFMLEDDIEYLLEGEILGLRDLD